MNNQPLKRQVGFNVPLSLTQKEEGEGAAGGLGRILPLIPDDTEEDDDDDEPSIVIGETLELSQPKSKFLGSGSYGCAFFPPLPSDQLTYDESLTQVSKLTTLDEAKSEIANAKFFKMLDPEGRYGLYPYRYVKLAIPQDHETASQIGRCTVTDNTDRLLFSPKYNSYSEDAVGLLLPQGDMDLYNYIEKAPKNNRAFIIKTIENFIELCKGFKIFHTYGLYHLDIKTTNILVSQGRFKMIDFGLSKTVKRLEAQYASRGEVPPISTLSYTMYPFYNKALYSYNSGERGGVEDDKTSLAVIEKLLYRNATIFRDYNNADTIRAIAENPRTPALVAWIAENTDTYSLALTLYEVLKRLGSNEQNMKSYEDFVMSQTFNRCGMNGFLERLGRWHKWVTNQPFIPYLGARADYTVLYPGPVHPFLGEAPLIGNISIQASNFRFVSADKLWLTLIGGEIHPLYYFEVLHLFNAYFTIAAETEGLETQSDDLNNSFMYALYKVVTNNKTINNFNGIFKGIRLDKVQDYVTKIKNLFNINDINGPQSVSYWLSKFSTVKSSDLSWPQLLTNATAYINRSVSDAKLAVTYAANYLRNYYPKEYQLLPKVLGINKMTTEEFDEIDTIFEEEFPMGLPLGPLLSNSKVTIFSRR
jgi:serine/threonine protein kinase